MEEKITLKPEDLNKAYYELTDGRVLYKKGYVIDTTRCHMPPIMPKIGVTFGDANDFINFVKEYKYDWAKAFYNDRCIAVMLDYPQKDKSTFNEQTARLSLEKTYEADELESRNNEWVSQVDFMRFLSIFEPRIKNIDSLGILEIAENLKLSTEVGSDMEYDKTSRSVCYEFKGGKKGVKLPKELILKFPLYNAIKEETEFKVDLRYSYSETKGFQIGIFCYDFVVVVRDETDRLVKDIVAKLDMKAYRIA